MSAVRIRLEPPFLSLRADDEWWGWENERGSRSETGLGEYCCAVGGRGEASSEERSSDPCLPFRSAPRAPCARDHDPVSSTPALREVAAPHPESAAPAGRGRGRSWTLPPPPGLEQLARCGISSISDRLRSMSFESTRHPLGAPYAISTGPVFLAKAISQPQ